MASTPPEQDAVCFPQTKYQLGVKEKQKRPDFCTAGLLEVVILYQRESKVNKMGKLLSLARKEVLRDRIRIRV